MLYNFDLDKESFLRITNSKILLYITDWDFQTSTINKMVQHKSEYDYLFIKPHPHIKIENLPVISGIDILYTTVLVEIIIDQWLQGGNVITIYHQDSTAIIPFGNEIISINVNENSDPDYSRILEDLISLANCKRSN